MFKQVVFQPMMTDIINAILKEIETERNGSLIDRDLMKEVVEIFLFLSKENMNVDDTNCKFALEKELLE